MDVSWQHAGSDMTAVVARGFEPVRIERLLLARAFDLVCELDVKISSAAREAAEQPRTEQSSASDREGRRAA